ISIMETDPTLDKSKLGIFIYPIKYDLDEAKILSSKLRENNYGKFAAFVINGTSTQDSIDQVAKALFEKKRSVVIQMAHGRKPLLGYESGGKTLETAFNFGRLCPPECDDDEDYITAAITNNYGELWDKIKIK
ncbi:MAG TPA: hypothetical protein PKD18_14985, partial [Saprospiraceae bacterium]|nr:hypothetical protein [Saprospiraceae bacterium]